MQGLLLIDKPEGITSFGAVARIKRIAGEKRVGHTGTLDPMATGVLPVLLGRSTALCSSLIDADKRYTATVRLGTVTDTCDITGEVLAKNEVRVNDAQIRGALKRFLGEIEQVPPMYSALKKDGVRLYELARDGKTIEIPARKITVHEITDITEVDENFEFSFSSLVSKGTYIRSLARDIGEALGCGATLSALRRTETGGFNIENCISLEALTEENLNEHILSAETAVMHLPEVCVTEKQAVRFCNGGQLSLERLKLDHSPYDGQLFRVKIGGRLLGLGFAENEKQQLAIKCVIDKFE